jgi:pilus assembly protein CpaB
LSSAAAAIGRVLAAPVGSGEALTSERLVGAGLGASLAAHGDVAAPVRLSDADVARLLHPGDIVDVVLAGSAGGSSAGASASVVAAAARVVTVVAPASDSVLGTSSSTDGSLVVLDVPRPVGLALAQAAALGPLSVLLDG